MKVEWRTIPAAPGYSVSNTGLVRSEQRVLIMKNGIQKTVRTKILRQHKAGSGYLAVHIGNKRRDYVHRLVALAFIGNPPPGCEVNHIDENKENNNADNLEWVTRADNLRHGTRNKRCKDIGMKQSKPVVATKDGRVIAEFASIREAGRAGYKRQCISKCCRNPAATHAGLHWHYKGIVSKYAKGVLVNAKGVKASAVSF